MKIAISKCLVGVNCRYDGTNKLTTYLNFLENHFELIYYCPEDEIFSTPRDTISIQNFKVINNITKEDVTKKLIQISKEFATDIKNQNICGVVLKSKSPSCGVNDTKLYKEDSYSYGSGVFTNEIKNIVNDIAIIDDKDLENEFLRFCFVLNTISFSDIKTLSIYKYRDLITFHSNYKFTLLAHNRVMYDRLGNIVANHDKLVLEDVIKLYKEEFLKTIKINIDRKNIYNSLIHIVGFMKKNLSSEEKKDILDKLKIFLEKDYSIFEIINDIKNYIQKYNIEYLKNQKILSEKAELITYFEKNERVLITEVTQKYIPITKTINKGFKQSSYFQP